MNASRCNSLARIGLGAVAAAVLTSAILPVPSFALSDPTPIGLPNNPPGSQPAEQPASPPLGPGEGSPAAPGGIGSAPLPPLPMPQPGMEPPASPGMSPGIQPAATGGDAPQAAPVPEAAVAAPGLLDDGKGGLGANLWQGSSAAELIALIPKLPAPQTQPSLRDLQLRLLLTKAPGPNAGGGIDLLVPLRAERLHAMGFSTEAMLLTKGAAADPRDAFEKALTAQDADTACAKVDEAIAGQQVMDLYWRKALVFCQIARGQSDQASLGLDLLRETAGKEPDTKDFITLASVLLGESKARKVKLSGAPDPLVAAMMSKAGLKPGAVQGAEPAKPSGLAGAAAASRDGSLPLNARIEAAELAFGGGLVTADELTGLYRQAKFTGDPLAMPDSPMMRAQLYQAADQAFDPMRRAQFVQRALVNARARGTYFAQGAIYRPIADKITPAPNLAWFAPEAARLMFWSGNVDRGGFWLNLAQGSSAVQPDIARALPGLQVLAQMAGLPGTYQPDPVMAWQQAGGNPGTAERLRGIQAGLGLPGGIAPAASGDAAAIGEAAQAGRRGETVLLALVALGGRGLAASDSAALAQSLGGISAVGLTDQARRIGLEAAILAGL
jgi:hypothetical protein